MGMVLVFPTERHKQAASAYKQEYIDCGETWIHGSGGFMKADSYEGWLKVVTKAQTKAPHGWVCSSTYFLTDGKRIIGTTQVRHSLNEATLHKGGHIGYGIRPSERGKGYGAQILALALNECRALGIDKALVTCDKDNAASAGAILRNGGVLENEFVEEDGNIVQRYWIAVPGQV